MTNGGAPCRDQHRDIEGDPFDSRPFGAVGALIAPRYTYIEPNGVFSPEISFIVVIRRFLAAPGVCGVRSSG